MRELPGGIERRWGCLDREFKADEYMPFSILLEHRGLRMASVEFPKVFEIVAACTILGLRELSSRNPCSKRRNQFAKGMTPCGALASSTRRSVDNP